jgi:hypothetical protein
MWYPVTQLVERRQDADGWDLTIRYGLILPDAAYVPKPARPKGRQPVTPSGFKKKRTRWPARAVQVPSLAAVAKAMEARLTAGRMRQ